MAKEFLIFRKEKPCVYGYKISIFSNEGGKYLHEIIRQENEIPTGYIDDRYEKQVLTVTLSKEYFRDFNCKVTEPIENYLQENGLSIPKDISLATSNEQASASQQ